MGVHLIIIHLNGIVCIFTVYGCGAVNMHEMVWSSVITSIGLVKFGMV